MKSILDRKKIDLDLTSLLDVIFIILMAVMCSKDLEADSAEETPSTVSDRDQSGENSDNTDDPGEESEDDTPGLVEIGRNVATIEIKTSLGTDEDPDDYSHRVFEIYVNESSTPYHSEKIEIDPDNEKDSYSQLSKNLTEIVETSKNSNGEYIPVLLSVDNGQLLYRDATELNSIVADIRKEDRGANLYYEDLRE